MQPLTAAPRAALSAAQVRALLTAPDLVVDYGVELLDASLAVVADISADVAACTVKRDMTAAVHGGIDLSISRQLAWGRDRVRPFMLLSSATAGVTNARFNLGVYLLATPTTNYAEIPITYAVTGFDQLYLLQNFIGDSYSVPAGANVLTAVRAALVAAGVTAPVLLDSTAGSAVYPAGGKVWPLTGSTASRWLDVVNDLLAAIGYVGIFCDWDGAFRSGPLVAPNARPVEWTFTVGDLVAGVVADDRTVTADIWGIPNRWVFYCNGLGGQPVEGSTQYTVTNPGTGASSQTSLGYVRNAGPQGLDAVDYAALVTQGDALVAAAMRSAETLTMKTSPLPIQWHADTAAYADAALGSTRQILCTSWSLALHDGSDQTSAWESVA